MKFLPIFFSLFYLNLYSQTIDTLSADTTKITTDTIRIIQDTTITDTTVLFKTDTTYAKADTTYPINQEPFFSSGFFVNRGTINKLDYRYTGDLFTPFSLSFLRDQGFVGQPNELLLYGAGFNGISYFEDGVFINNRNTNSFDLNFVQNEYIDSIEIVPLPRGFLYGAYNNPVSVNFLTRDFISLAPYTRIKYYEGPFGEAMVDGIFNSLFFGKFNLSFDITNKVFDSSYTNSDFSIWQAKFRLKYLLSNSINIIGSYYLVDSDVGLNGGVDVDSILQITSDVNSILYGNVSVPVTPVAFTTRRLETNQHNFNLKLLGNFTGNFKTDVNLYYRFNQDLIKHSEDSLRVLDKDKMNIYGISLKQKYETGIMNFELNGNYDYTDFKFVSGSNNVFSEYSSVVKVIGISPVISFNLLDGIIKPSLFYKYTKYDNVIEDYSAVKSYNGFGFDVDVQLHQDLKLYLGYSSYESIINDNINTLEMSLRYSHENTFVSLRVFNRTGIITTPYLFTNDIFRTYRDFEMWGIGASANFYIWKLLVESTTSFYLPQHSHRANPPITQASFPDLDFTSGLPKYTFNGGIYYKDSLFSNNLDLKTGFSFQYTGEQRRYTRQDEVNLISHPSGIPSSFRIDFTLAGEIQKAAIVYFTWENLLDEDYYIVPFYPMRERGVRFGLAWELFN
jgi:hypothetical protein